MNPAIESLLEVVDRDPLPEPHTSSYWKQYSKNFEVEKRGEELILLSGWTFGSFAPMNFRAKILHGIERFSYRSVTAQWKSFPRVWRVTKRLIKDLSGGINFTVFKSACVLSLLADHWESARLSPKVFVLIGDGYGFLGALIRRWIPDAKVYHVDLPKMLVFQARTHELADSRVALKLLTRAEGSPAGSVTLVLPQDVEKIPGPVDCAVNIVSMQEMSESSIRAYFSFLRRRSMPQSHFYCLNRVEKQLPGGEVLRFAEYPWRPEDQILVDGVCPFYTHFLASPRWPQGPRFLGKRIPWINHFDGVHLHRLVHLDPLSDGMKKGPESEKDMLFLETATRASDFEFDAKVAQVFDDMVTRSVPFYRELQYMVVELAKQCFVEGSRIYDLGCATGTTLVNLYRAIGDRAEAYIGLDSSEEMLKQAASKLEKVGLSGRMDLRVVDLTDPRLVLERASVVTMGWTLQFIRPFDRAGVVERVSRGMLPGGVFIVIDKILNEEALTNRLFVKLYYDYKKRNGYSDEEIAHKREALENVLIPYRIDENLQMFRQAGFKVAEPFFQWYNFAGFLCVKS